MSLLPHDLLDQASRLVTLDKQRPKQANLRRAVSTAYYALFHFLIEEATALVIGTSGNKRPLCHLVGRAFTHTQMKAVCVEMGKTTPVDLLKPFWTTYGITSLAELRNVADAFVELQQERHRADYDLSRPFTRQEAGNDVKTAQNAIADWQRLKQTNRDAAKFYAFCLLCWGSWQGRR